MVDSRPPRPNLKATPVRYRPSYNWGRYWYSTTLTVKVAGHGEHTVHPDWGWLKGWVWGYWVGKAALIAAGYCTACGEHPWDNNWVYTCAHCRKEEARRQAERAQKRYESMPSCVEPSVG